MHHNNNNPTCVPTYTRETAHALNWARLSPAAERARDLAAVLVLQHPCRYRDADPTPAVVNGDELSAEQKQVIDASFQDVLVDPAEAQLAAVLEEIFNDQLAKYLPDWISLEAHSYASDPESFLDETAETLALPLLARSVGNIDFEGIARRLLDDAEQM